MAEGDTLYLVDGTYNIFRAFHARGVPEMRARDGTPTKATYIFTRILLSILQSHSPRYLGVAFDPEGPTLRHGEYDRYVEQHPEAAAAMAGYKATRPEVPPELLEQFPWCRKICEAFGFPILELPGYEADDIIGTLALQASEMNLPVMIVTADKDLFQLVGDGVRILNPHKDNLVMDAEIVEKEFGVRPEQVPDVLALMGDTTDNIPGVPGIGEKGAKELVRQFGSLEKLIARAGEIPRKVQRAALEQYADRARLSRELARIRTDAPIQVDLEALTVSEPDRTLAREIFTRLEFRSMLEKYAGGPEVSSVERPAAPPVRYRVLSRATEISGFVREAAEAGQVCLRVETAAGSPASSLPAAASIDLRQAGIVGISLSGHPHEAVYIPLDHSLFGAPGQPSWRAVAEALAPLLADPRVRKIGHNLKRELSALRGAGMQVAGLSFDTMVASYLLEPDRRSYQLEALARDYLGEEGAPAAEPVQEGEEGGGEIERAARFSSALTDATGRLEPVLRERLRQENLLELLETIEMPLIEVLEEMERVGVRIDIAYLRNFSSDLEREMERISQEAYAIAGHPFNLDSPIQLRKVLFEEIGLKPVGRTVKTRAFSTRDEDLEALADLHALPAKIRDYRMVSKLRGTYADALPRLVNPATGRVHASFNQTGAASGRLSSSDPNLQNVPIRTELGRRIRRAFLPEEGWRLVCADYSQIELRVLAHMSGDEAFREAFLSGEDIHRSTAARIFGVPYEEVTADQRRAAKTVNFGIVYGMGDFRLSRELGIPREEARRFISAYFNRYSSVRRYIDETMARAEKTGETRTLFGRLRRFPEVKSSNFNIRQQALRAAVNMTIQGTAADLIKMAMASLHGRLGREGRAARMLIQVHDELVLETPPEEVPALRELLRHEMENVHELNVPLHVEIKEGDNWLEAK
ncbi:MAG: DNA polymerase I [Acidobacteria bacterium]|nr:MAG: DNA polymerase I [Acidobacteriota bacterium]